MTIDVSRITPLSDRGLAVGQPDPVRRTHDNADSDGEDADGFAAKLTTGTGNVFRYAVAHNNIDDGWDLYTKSDTGAIGPVTIEDSLAYENGTLTDGSQAGNGDRNGYKLGGDDIAVNHIVRRSIAYDNGKHGFTWNSNPGTMAVSGNVSIDNAERTVTAGFSWVLAGILVGAWRLTAGR